MKDKEAWDGFVDKNKDPYGKACIDVAARVMELLDKYSTPLKNGYNDIDTAHGLICKANKDIGVDSLTGFQAQCVVQMICLCHVRGEEFMSSHMQKIGEE